MTEQDYELLSQYLDGELAAPATQELRKRLLAEPQLRANLERLKSVDSKLKNAFDIPGVKTVPPQVVQLLENAQSKTGRSSAQRRAGWGLAIAASLLAATGLLLQPQLRQQTPEYSAASATGDTPLSRVLEYSASRADGWDSLEDGRQVRALLSFQNTRGDWCREYILSDQDSNWRGVACRAEGQWITKVLSVGVLAGSVNEYRPAGTTDSDEVASFIDTHAANIALSQKEEEELIANKWQ